MGECARVCVACVAKLQNGQFAILYNNNLVNSSLSWRPLRLLFQKESIALIKEEKERLDRQRNELESEEYELFEGITVKFRGYYTMCDMKGCVWICPEKSLLKLLWSRKIASIIDWYCISTLKKCSLHLKINFKMIYFGFLVRTVPWWFLVWKHVWISMPKICML